MCTFRRQTKPARDMELRNAGPLACGHALMPTNRLPVMCQMTLLIARDSKRLRENPQQKYQSGARRRYDLVIGQSHRKLLQPI